MPKRIREQSVITYWCCKGIYIIPAAGEKELTAIFAKLQSIKPSCKAHFILNCKPVSILIELIDPLIFQNSESDYFISPARNTHDYFETIVNKKKIFYDGKQILHRDTVICDDCFLIGELVPHVGCKKHNKKSCKHKKQLVSGCLSCLQKSFASRWQDIVCQWSKKNQKTPGEVYKSTKMKYGFECTTCKHSFSTSPDYLYSASGCPFCSSRQLCDLNTCAHCYSKSFASHSRALQWSDENLVKARNVFKNSTTSYRFKCEICQHSFLIRLSNITQNDSWCQFCANQILCENDDCISCFNKSLASQNCATNWSSNNTQSPRQIFKSSSTKKEFICYICNHSFFVTPAHIMEGRWCPFCVNKKLCTDDKCKNCYSKSFACHPRALYWSKENNLSPRYVSLSSNKQFLFVCQICKHLFNSSLHNIVFKGDWCPFCSHNRLCVQELCQQCYKNSFASCQQSLFWSTKNHLKPRNVFKKSNQKFYLDCPKCDHEVYVTLYDVVQSKGFCKFCVGHVCGDSCCQICARSCDICQTRKGKKYTKLTRRFCCEICFKDCIARDPNETPLQFRRKITLEIFTLAELQRIAIETDSLTFYEPTSWDCAILPNLNFKPDIIWCFDEYGNLFTTAGACKLDTREIYYTIVLEIIEESRKAHSAARSISDEDREKEIRNVFGTEKIGFLYVTVAHAKHTSAHVDDIFFDRDSEEYFVINEKFSFWQTRISHLVKTLQNMLDEKSCQTVVLGH